MTNPTNPAPTPGPAVGGAWPLNPADVPRRASQVGSAASVLALLLFLFLPQLELSCQNTEVLTQNGIQVITGSASFNDDLGEPQGPSDEQTRDEMKEKGGAAVLLALMPIGLAVTAVAGWMATRRDAGGAGVSGSTGGGAAALDVQKVKLAAAGAAVAVLVLLFYLLSGFPMEDALDDAIAEARGDARQNAGDPFAAMGPGAVAAVARVDRTGWLVAASLFTFLAALGAGAAAYLTLRPMRAGGAGLGVTPQPAGPPATHAEVPPSSPG